MPKERGTAAELAAADFMDKLEHPMKMEIEALRAIVRDADARLVEGIKWNAPSYSVDGQDRVTFNLQGKGMIRLVFHAGAKKNDLNVRATLGEDPTRLLEWAADDRAIVKLVDMDDVREKADKIGETVRRWLEATS
ncbi:DUF1801 domain-containing protein [Cohnella rhizosphaerae]|uniref:DUF1801 domain-containing protein n=1 Tax=Cohnella rhizosphaerae TaxID=1457232 RepID=A0A9X4QUS1_9BACL|nr:DUF1801 domain-containing protein [Cohnella rhizosphaerae]MDG0810777.1 DUF1801 domain-containing protein [Cohnella rhizosphaerae]